MQLLDGKKASLELFSRLQPRINNLHQAHIFPKLVFFLIGKNPASIAYVAMKEKAAKTAEIQSQILRYEDSVSEEEILQKIEDLNQDLSVHGMMVQLPLPHHLSLTKITNAFDPKKDADGFHPLNVGNMTISKESEFLPPATALGIIYLLEAYKIPIEGKRVTVLGRSNLIGKPIALMLINRGATVTICHSKTTNAHDFCMESDIIISATGVPNLVKADWVKENAAVIDAGYSKIDGKIAGDVDFQEVSPKCSWITPVPGGVGPMTIYAILENTVKAAEWRLSNISL